MLAARSVARRDIEAVLVAEAVGLLAVEPVAEAKDSVVEFLRLPAAPVRLPSAASPKLLPSDQDISV